MQSMNDLMHHFLRDMYYAEKLSVKSMAKMVKAVEEGEKGPVLDRAKK